MQKITMAACAAAVAALGFNQAAAAGTDGHGLEVIRLHNSFSVAAGATYQKYTSGEDSVTVDGWLPSIKASASYMSPALYLVSVSTQYSFGDQDSNAIDQSIDNDIVSVNLRIGKGFLVSNQFLVTPFVSYDHRYWNQELSIGSGSLTLEHNTNYLGAGIMLDYQAAPRLILSAEALAGGTFANTLDLDASGGSDNIDGDVDSGLIVKSALKADYRFRTNWHVFGAADFTYFDYGDVEILGVKADAGDLYDISLSAGVRYTY